MPLYEYQCRDCRRLFEIIQKFSDDALTDCSECGGTLEKVLSAPAFHLKGSGWYKTDYAPKAGGEKETSPDSKPDSKAEKPEKKDSSDEKKVKKSPKKKSDSTK